MIETIYIPTIRRADTQITYEHLPDSLKQHVCMVVEESERHLYNYPCDYLVLPKEIVGTHTQLAQTRKFIHKHAGTKKYLMIDDDLIIRKRNRKYFGLESDMEVSKRDATPEEIVSLFEQASKILDTEEFGVVGVSDSMFVSGKLESDCVCVNGIVFCDGRKISKVIDSLDTSTRVAEDIMFLFHVLSHGINTKVLGEFTFNNKSEQAALKDKRPIWEDTSGVVPDDVFQTDAHYDDLRRIQRLSPDGMTITQDASGRKKNVKHWKKVYKSAFRNDLTSFM